jgi:regulator of replication initiation timing
MPRTSITIHQGKKFEQVIEQIFQAAYKRAPDENDFDDMEQIRHIQQYFATDQRKLETWQMAIDWRLYEITGHTSNIDEALDEFEAVQKAVGELFDENQALRILNRRMVLTLSFASQAMDIVERDAQMFITPKARSWIEKFREQYTKLNAPIARSKLITQTPPRRNKNAVSNAHPNDQ